MIEDSSKPEQDTADGNRSVGAPAGPLTQRDPDRDIRQFARCLAGGAVRVCRTEPEAPSDTDEAGEVGVIAPAPALGPLEATSA